MLSQDDAALVRRDPLLPGLSKLLDVEAFGEVLRASLDLDMTTAPRATYVRYKPATSCLVAYEVDSPKGSVVIHATAYPVANAGKLRPRPRVARIERGSANGHVVLPELAMTLCRFPADASLRGLRRLTRKHSRERMLRELFPAEAELWRSTLSTLRYKPERRYVGALAVNGERWGVARVYADDDVFNASLAVSDGFSREPAWLEGVRFPRRLARVQESRTLILEWLSGRPVTLLLEENVAGAIHGAGVAGSVAATIHGRKIAGAGLRCADHPGAVLTSAEKALSELAPSLESRVFALTRRLAPQLAYSTGEARTVHGDFYADQLLQLEDGCTGVLDLDRVAAGDPAADLGCFLGHIQRAAISGDVSRPAPDLANLGGAMLAGYAASAAPPPFARVRAHAAAVLLRLAVEPFRRREPSWLARTEAIVASAEMLGAFPSHVRSGAAG